MLVDRLSLIVILVFASPLSISTAQRWPLQDLLHRLRMYQANPRVFRPRGPPPPPPPPQPLGGPPTPSRPLGRSPPPSLPFGRPPPSSQIHPRRKDLSEPVEMSYTEKKAALKRLLLKSAVDQKKPTDSVAPLALSLLQKLKEKPSQADKHPSVHPTKPTKKTESPHTTGKSLTPPTVNIKVKPSGKFSPPRDLDSGFTPFFKQSKAFDEKTYLESLTTATTTEDTTETTVGVTLSVAEATQMFGEKKETKAPGKRIKSVAKKVPAYMRSPIKDVMRKKSKQEVPYEDVGFTKNWNFESEKFYDSDDIFGVTSPTEAASPTVPFTRKSQYPVKESFVDWERRNTKRRYDTRDYVRTRPQNTEIYSPTPRPKIMKKKIGNDDNGFMGSVPFTFPDELKSFSGKTFNELDWARKGSEEGKYFKPKPESNKLRNTDRADFPPTGTRNQNTGKYSDNQVQQEINSFGDDFSFSNSRIGDFFNDIEGNFPNWESRRYR